MKKEIVQPQSDKPKIHNKKLLIATVAGFAFVLVISAFLFVILNQSASKKNNDVSEAIPTPTQSITLDETKVNVKSISTGQTALYSIDEIEPETGAFLKNDYYIADLADISKTSNVPEFKNMNVTSILDGKFYLVQDLSNGETPSKLYTIDVNKANLFFEFPLEGVLPFGIDKDTKYFVYSTSETKFLGGEENCYDFTYRLKVLNLNTKELKEGYKAVYKNECSKGDGPIETTQSLGINYPKVYWMNFAGGGFGGSLNVTDLSTHTNKEIDLREALLSAGTFSMSTDFSSIYFTDYSNEKANQNLMKVNINTKKVETVIDAGKELCSMGPVNYRFTFGRSDKFVIDCEKKEDSYIFDAVTKTSKKFIDGDLFNEDVCEIDHTNSFYSLSKDGKTILIEKKYKFDCERKENKVYLVYDIQKDDLSKIDISEFTLNENQKLYFISLI